MKGVTTWSHQPYRPFEFDVGDVYICRVAPSKNAIHFEWLGLNEDAEYEISCRKRGDEQFAPVGRTKNCEFDICGLEENTDYEFFVESEGKKAA